MAELTREGFDHLEPCNSDPSISRMTFYRKGTGIIPVSTSATAFWKADETGAIVWTTGTVFFSSL